MMPFLYRNTKKKKEIEKQQQQHHHHSDTKYWKWPSCKQYPKTQSFRGGAACGITDDDDVIFKTVNSVFLSEHDHQIKHDQDQPRTSNLVTPAINWFTNTTNSSSCDHTNNTTLVSSDEYRLQQEECDDDLQEMVLARGVKSDRLFFDPNASASGAKLLVVLQEKDEEVKNEIKEISRVNNVAILTNNNSVNMMVMESEDPYRDFRRSMEEMVNCNEDDDHNNWEYLEELLYLYLRLNGKKNHGYIIKALVDLVTDISTTSGSSDSVGSSSSSALIDLVTNLSSTSAVTSSSSSAYSSAVSSFSFT